MISSVPSLPLDGRDEDHLGLLASLHLVLGGLMLVCLVLVPFHYRLMIRGMPVADSMLVFIEAVYGIIVTQGVLAGLMNVASGLVLRRRKHRLLSLITAGFNCTLGPVGIALSVFTFLVLNRGTVRQHYADQTS